MAKIKKKLAETMDMNVRDVEAILTQIVTEGVNSYKPLYDFKGIEFVPFERNEYAQFLVKHWAQQTSETMLNLSRTKALCFDRYNVAGDLIGSTPLEGVFKRLWTMQLLLYRVAQQILILRCAEPLKN